MATLREFAKQALSRQEVARFGPKGMGRPKQSNCTSTDISDNAKAIKGSCLPVFSLKKAAKRQKPKKLGQEPATAPSGTDLPAKDLEASPTGK